MELQRLGFKVKLALPKNTCETPEGKTFFSDLIDEMEWIPLPEIKLPPGKSRAKLQLQILRDTLQKVRPDHAYVPYADGISQAWGMQRKPDSFFSNDAILECLMMRGGFAYPAANLNNRIKNEISWKLQQRARWNKVHHLDPLVLNAIKNRNPAYAKNVFLIPEAIEPLTTKTRPEALQQLGLKQGDPLIVCPGGVNETKGSDLIARAVSRLPRDFPCRLLLFGKHSDHLKKLSESLAHDKRIIFKNQFASPEEFDCLFAAAELVATCYPRHIGSASILIRSAAADKKVLASDFGWIGWACDNFKLGQTCRAGDVDAIRDGLICTLKSTTEPSSENQQSKKAFVDYHTLPNHIAHFTSLICELHGKPAPKLSSFPSPVSIHGI